MPRTLCLLSALIYEYRDEFYVNCICDKWSINNHLLGTNNSQLIYGLFTVGNDLVLVFKGSTTWNDYLTDIDFERIDDEFGIPGKMHKGFYELLFKNSDYNKIIDDIRSFNFDKLYITGHSLGGALSTIFYAYVISCFEFNVELVNFGAPIVGDRKFANHIVGTRYVNDNDIIPKISIPFIYKHIKKEFLLGKKRFWKWSTVDHDIYLYLDKLSSQS
ncbi:MAG: lipase family protein [Cetobacterium sp.]